MRGEWEKFEGFIHNELERDEKLESEISERIFSGLRANLSQQRSMLTHIAIVGGALASFSLLRLGSSWGRGKILLIFAIIILLVIIACSFYLLNKILDYENTELTKLLQEYSDMFSERKDIIGKVLENRNIPGYFEDLKELHDNFRSKRKTQEANEKSKIDWWNRGKKILIYAFILALILDILSFII